MNNNQPLLELLKDYFNQSLSSIPNDLQKRVTTSFFPMKWDNLNISQRKKLAEIVSTQENVSNIQDKSFESAFIEFSEDLPELKRELTELNNIQPENMVARNQKQLEIQRIEKQIADILSGGGKRKGETPAERITRLKNWLNEEISSKGDRGAQARTAKREGISRQRLSEILGQK